MVYSIGRVVGSMLSCRERSPDISLGNAVLDIGVSISARNVWKSEVESYRDVLEFQQGK